MDYADRGSLAERMAKRACGAASTRSTKRSRTAVEIADGARRRPRARHRAPRPEARQRPVPERREPSRRRRARATRARRLRHRAVARAATVPRSRPARRTTWHPSRPRAAPTSAATCTAAGVILYELLAGQRAVPVRVGQPGDARATRRCWRRSRRSATTCPWRSTRYSGRARGGARAALRVGERMGRRPAPGAVRRRRATRRGCAPGRGSGRHRYRRDDHPSRGGRLGRCRDRRRRRGRCRECRCRGSRCSKYQGLRRGWRCRSSSGPAAGACRVASHPAVGTVGGRFEAAAQRHHRRGAGGRVDRGGRRCRRALVGRRSRRR